MTAGRERLSAADLRLAHDLATVLADREGGGALPATLLAAHCRRMTAAAHEAVAAHLESIPHEPDEDERRAMRIAAEAARLAHSEVARDFVGGLLDLDGVPPSVVAGGRP